MPRLFHQLRIARVVLAHACILCIMLTCGALAAQPAAGRSVTETARDFWCFRPIKSTAPPDVADSAWRANPIDRFILARLEERKFRPARPAAKIDLVRRVYFDVTGLPPTPREVKAFLDDHADDAYERLVDQLLASPHFGERAAQHWLDVVRYAETEGFEYDRHLPGAWQYRDYVVAAFNEDKPFDRFVVEQVAGDEIAPGDRQCEIAAIFHRLGPVRRNAGNPEFAASRNEILTERTDIIGAAFLGLTVNCARCHNHKFDPISQKDYYRLQAYMAATEEHNIKFLTVAEKRKWDREAAPFNAAIEPLEELARFSPGVIAAMLKQQVRLLKETLPPAPAPIPGIRNDFAHRTEIHVLRRGVWENKDEVVGPRPLSVFVSDQVAELPADEPAPRTQLARWLTDPRNPLTARVIVNRIWQDHFGQGIVRTANNFGINGERPTHPELLDFLAAQLVSNGWHLKPLHRLMLLSNAYRQSSKDAVDQAALRSDPEDRLLWRFPRRRLSAEEIRDAMFAAAGQLNLAVGGPSVMLPVDPDLTNQLYEPTAWKASTSALDHRRRSIYLIAKRNLRLPFMESFDQPTLTTSCSRRESTTHAPQALELLNGKLANDLAAVLADRLETDCGNDRGQMIEEAYQLTMGRAPTVNERALAIQFLQDQPVKEFALALFNLNGFLYVQ